ncbi:hypothetical protein [Streptomyces sp. NPDC001292]|uniref:hypothetical protein n=1 Tax=Streptomyces sp. NPDC001292 TaxID=3364558 RepID=UPI003698CC54
MSSSYRYVINKGHDSERQVEAIGFATVGDFIDFFNFGGRGENVVTLRIRAAYVDTVERIST